MQVPRIAAAISVWLLFTTIARAASPEETARVQRIILASRHMGAHGLGYNSRSLEQLSRSLHPNDVPVLIELAAAHPNTGALFGLASQCQSAIDPLLEAAKEKKIAYLDAEDTMDLASHFEGCSADGQARAAESKIRITELRQAEDARMAEEFKRKQAEDRRIQENSLKLLDPARRGELTRKEREEVYQRSIKAAGLENPTTPEQKALVERMYRTMVLGEGSASSNDAPK